MRTCNAKYLRDICNWPSAAVLAAIGFVATPSQQAHRTPCPGNVNSEVHAQDLKCDLEVQRANASSYDPPWWKKLFGMKQQKDDIMEKYILDSIRKNEHNNGVNLGCVRMFDTNWIAANKPIEDRHSEFLLKNSGLLFFGIFDGHSGWHCSETVRNRLPLYTALALTDSFTLGSYLADKDFQPNTVVEALTSHVEHYQVFHLPKVFYEKQAAIGCGELAFIKEMEKGNSTVNVEDSLKKAFSHLDNHICSEAIPEGKVDESLLTGIAGSCAIVALLEQDYINIANAGDCRAVLGRRKNNGRWKAVQLSADHCAENKDELKRLNDAHPDQKGRIIANGRLLGQLQPLRAFGDVQYKWSKHLHERVLNVVYGRSVVPAALYKSPPYLIAEPEVTRHRLQADDEFLIIATDGLWEKVSNEHAVEIIGNYIDSGEAAGGPSGNGSTRLIRYALGKGNDQTVAKMLQIPDAYKRNFHDDITITVIYFNRSMLMSKL